jgi:DNA-binding MarR family transcriptional regulator
VGVDTRTVPGKQRRGLTLAMGLPRAAAWFSSALVLQVRAAGWEGLTASQLHALPELAAVGKAGIRPAVLARRLGVTRQSVQKLLDGLLAVGLVAVHPDPSDGRATVATLTDSGRRLSADLADAASKVERELAKRIGKDEVAALAALLADGWRFDGNRSSGA